MTDQPTASKRMAEILSQYTNALAIRNIAAWGEYDVEKARAQLLTAIAEIEQRAEKWERLARSAVKATVFYPDVNDKARIMIEMEQAIAALGDEWDEATR